MKGILTGMQVVEASAFVAAPLGGMTLAQLGADVIRIDHPAGGLDYRRWPVTADNHSLFWAGLNKSKRSVAINFRDPQGAELAQAIITRPGPGAGMLLTNFPPRGWLDYETLRQRREDLVQVTVQGDRHGGSAVDYTLNPRLGLPWLTGPEGLPDPVNHVLPAWDLMTGQMAALGLLAAERHRGHSGEGQHVKLPLSDVALAVMGHLGFIAEAQLGVERERAGNHLFGAMGRDFATADGERVMVVGLTGRQWKSLCAATGSEGAMKALGQRLDRDLRQEGERFAAREAIAGIIGGWIGQRPLAEVARSFDAHGVCWSRYQTVRQMVEEDPECSPSNPLFAEIDQPDVGRYIAPGAPWQFSAFERQPAQPAPRLGQHTDEVLADELGLDAAHIGRLHDAGIVAGASQAEAVC